MRRESGHRCGCKSMDTWDEQQALLDRQVETLGAADYRVVSVAYNALVDAGRVGLDAVIRGLSHPIPRVRRGCAEFLDHQGSDVCVEALCQAAQHDPIPYVRRVAIHSL